MNDDFHRSSEMLDEYDFSEGERGKYAERFAKGSNVVVLSPDVAKSFPDSESVNRASGCDLRRPRQRGHLEVKKTAVSSLSALPNFSAIQRCTNLRFSREIPSDNHRPA